MRTSISLLLLPLLMGGWVWAGGNSSSAQAAASISIVRPIVLKNTKSLWFGALLVEPGFASGVIKQNAASGGGTREPDPTGVIQVALSTEHWHNAEFEITGEPDANFSVHLPHGNILIHSGLAQLIVRDLNYYTNSSIGSSGVTKMWIGGTLLLPSNPAMGHYQALCPVTVAYY